MQPVFTSKQKILVLGLGETGASVLRWLQRHQYHEVWAADTREQPPQLKQLKETFTHVQFYLGEEINAACARADVIIVSPGVPISHPALMAARQRGADILGDVELFARLISRLTEPPIVIGITGSNGKSTVTTMVGEMLSAGGYATSVIGNIGTPVLDVMGTGQQSQAYVLELSSFQLETTNTLELNAATVLNVTEDHLDRYSDMAAYAAAKERIFTHCQQRIVNRQDEFSLNMADGHSWSFGLDQPLKDQDWGLVQDGQKLMVCQGTSPYFEITQLPLAGLHNVANAMAALALTSAVGLPIKLGVETLLRFNGLPHRVELITKANGISFFDDSKGTNVGATVAALEGLPQKVVLIAGGDGKGQDFSPLGPALAKQGRAIVLIGRDAPLIEQAVSESGVPVSRAVDMKEAVNLALGYAQDGDAVLLSPACASFDMFDNYLHRAQVFIHAVKQAVGEST